jgi:hypothetical protein
MPWPHEFDERAVSRLPSIITEGSPECKWHRIGGDVVSKLITLVPGAGPATYDCFVFTGSLEILGLWGIFETVADTTVVTLSSFQWHDGGAAHALTNDQNCSGAAVNSSILKTAIAANALSFINSTTGGFAEVAATNKALQGFYLTEKNGAVNKIKFHCTQDGATAATIRIYCEWVCRNQLGSNVVAA